MWSLAQLGTVRHRAVACPRSIALALFELVPTLDRSIPAGIGEVVPTLSDLCASIMAISMAS